MGSWEKSWTATGNLNRPRAQQVNTVLLADGRVFLAGGIDGPDGGPAEIFDPRHPAAGWVQCATMATPRGYHSAAILLADGSVLMGGDKPGAWKSGETTPHERYFPSYYTLARPVITAAPATTTYGADFGIQTPNPAGIAEVVLIRPGAVTHGVEHVAALRRVRHRRRQRRFGSRAGSAQRQRRAAGILLAVHRECGTGAIGGTLDSFDVTERSQSRSRLRDWNGSRIAKRRAARRKHYSSSRGFIRRKIITPTRARRATPIPTMTHVWLKKSIDSSPFRFGVGEITASPCEGSGITVIIAPVF